MEILVSDEYLKHLGDIEFRYKPILLKVAVEEGETLGFVILGENPFHPHNNYVHIEVKPAYRKRGIGSALLQSIGLDAEKSLQVGVSGSDMESVAFLENHGFQRKRSTYFFSEYSRAIAKNKVLEGLPKLVSASPKTMQQISEKLYQDYVENHKGINALNPDIPKETAIETLLCGIDREHSFYLVEGDALAYCLVERDEDSAFICYCGGNLAQDAKKKFFEKALAILAVIFISIEFEIDDVDTSAMLLYSLLPKRDYPAYYTYVRPLQRESNGV